MRAISAWLCFLLCTAGQLTAIAGTGRSEDLTFLSTQLRPIAEAQKMRNVILKDFPRKVDYITEQPQRLSMHIEAEQQGGPHTIDVVGGLHGELQPLALQDALLPLDGFAAAIGGRGIAKSLMAFGKFGTAHQLYIPWMQASYIMVADKKALAYLPRGVDINDLGYDQLLAWAAAIREKTGRRLLGFPGGPQGLIPRFFEGSLYPSYTGGVVVPFRSEAAKAMWVRFAALWKNVNPNSTAYNFMAQPLLSGEVWIGWDHVARVLDALQQKPDQFVAFPVPAGPEGRGYMPVLAGLAVPRDAPDVNGAMALIDYLTRPQVQLMTARTVGFFPVVMSPRPPELDPGARLAAAAIERTQSMKGAFPALPPSGLGRRGGEFDKVFTDTFRLIVLRGEEPRAVLDREAATLARLIAEAGAPCWRPDPPSKDACRVQ